MKLYNVTLDRFTTTIHPCFSKGDLTHYVIKDQETNEIVSVSVQDMEDFADVSKCEALS